MISKGLYKNNYFNSQNFLKSSTMNYKHQNNNTNKNNNQYTNSFKYKNKSYNMASKDSNYFQFEIKGNQKDYLNKSD